ncbi:uncharacterized protein LOC134222612 [Armigeres subalbatus]|uniref:uncharacterized protein LOC134222612 n=1 Tax=Armigeres subalbatus TaxID=124917 RepID=UPI002ED456AA
MWPETSHNATSVIGWVASGRAGSNRTTEHTSKLAYVTSAESLDAQLAHFWEIESCWNKSTFSLEETACEEHFSSNVSRDESGRFVVTLPKRSSMLNLLGSSKEIATRRFFALERRLQANPKLMEAYSAFIEEYHQLLNHMREVVDEEIFVSCISYYLPHHGVEKADSTTTKPRVVIDASCSTHSGISLNQVLMRILWRSSPDQPFRTFELSTVTYGTAFAPYLTTKCLQQLSKDGSEEYPLAAFTLAKDFCTDMLTGVD